MEKTKSLNVYDGQLLFWNHDGKEYCLHVEQEQHIDDPRKDTDPITIMACFDSRHPIGDDVDFKDPGEFIRDLVEQHGDRTATNRKIREMAMPPYALKAVASEVYINGTLGIPVEKLSSADLSDDDLFQAFLDAVRDTRLSDVAIESIRDQVAVLPIWIYDHSGITISCGARTYPYNDQWDSGQVGWIAAKRDAIVESLQCQPHEWREKAVELMQADVRTYDMYLTGDVYWYRLLSRPIVENPDEDSSDEDWEEEDSCGGFYGSDVLANGMLESAGNEAENAVASGEYRTGQAETVRHVTYTLRKD